MSRSGYLIAAALALAISAAGVLVWTDYFGLSGTTKRSVQTAGSDETRTPQLVKLMTQVSDNGGVAATFSDRDMASWQTGAGHKLERYSLGGGEAIMARLTSTLPLDPSSVDWRTSATSFVLPLEFAQRSNGKRIEVGIVARAPSTNASPRLAAAYATSQAGNSGWKGLALSGEFQLIKFFFDVPGVETGYQNQPLIAFHSDPEGQGRSIELLGAYARLASE